MLELMLACAVAAVATPAPSPAASPPAELLEFIGEWSEEEAARFLDRDAVPQAAQDDAGAALSPEQEHDR